MNSLSSWAKNDGSSTCTVFGLWAIKHLYSKPGWLMQWTGCISGGLLLGARVRDILIFTVWLHIIQCTVLLSQFCPSVCASVRLSDACIVTEEIIVCQYLNTIRNGDISSISTPTGVARNCPLTPEIFAKMTVLQKRRLPQISAFSTTTENSNFLQIISREENANKLHFTCNDLNSSTRVTVYAECI